MPKITVAQKNDYFTYFQIDGMEGKFRMQRQVWNACGISMMIQGPSWDGKGINGFGKRHLLATEGGHKAGDVAGKAKSILAKRGGGLGSGKRSNRFNAMMGTLVPTPDGMRDPAVRTKFTEKKQRVSGALEKGYATNAYGPNTDICTFVILDGMSLDEVAGYFASAILDANMAVDSTEEVAVVFPTDCVIDAKKDGTINHYNSIVVEVRRGKTMYHIYHCCGAKNVIWD